MISAANRAAGLELGNVPELLRSLPRWVVWKTEVRNGKPTKVPYNAKSGKKAKSNNEATWAPFGIAASMACRGFDGPGFVLTADDGLVGIDLDGCRDPQTGAIADWATPIIELLASYAEVSPSKSGVKIFCRGKLTVPRGMKKKWKVPGAPAMGGKNAGIELYASGIFFAVTGWRLPGPSEPQEAQAAIDALVAQQPKRAAAAKQPETSTPDMRTLFDQARKYIDKMPAAVSGNFGHNAAFAVACTIYRFGLDGQDAETLFRMYSGRCEPPWNNSEIAHKLQSARDTVTAAGEFGSKAAQQKAGKRKRERLITIDARHRTDGGDRLPSDCPSLKTDNGRTDRANALRFAAMFGDRVRWVDRWRKFLVWDGRRWALDDQRESEALGKRVSDAIWHWTANNLKEMPRDQADGVSRFARYSASSKGIAAMLGLARSEPGIPILPDQLDSHPMLFNAANGTIDLHTGELLAHDRRHLLTKIAPVEYLQGAEAECPLWEAAIDKIFCGSAELTTYARKLFGSALVGQVTEHILPILWGDGSNGKTLLVETMLEVFGEYGGKAAPDLLLAKTGTAHPTEKADLFGKRLVFAVENDEGRRLAEAQIKELTGGDTIKGRRMHENFWEFRPSHMLALVTNHRPRVRGQDHGVWRRLVLVPFTAKFWQRDKGETGPPDMEADKQLKNKLRPELGGILTWLVGGCLEWQRAGLGQPAAVRAATSDYKAAEDVLAAFLAETCTIDCSTDETGELLAKVRASALQARLNEWCKTAGEKQVSARRLGEYLAHRRIKKHVSNGTWYCGIKIN